MTIMASLELDAKTDSYACFLEKSRRFAPSIISLNFSPAYLSLLRFRDCGHTGCGVNHLLRLLLLSTGLADL